MQLGAVRSLLRKPCGLLQLHSNVERGHSASMRMQLDHANVAWCTSVLSTSMRSNAKFCNSAELGSGDLVWCTYRHLGEHRTACVRQTRGAPETERIIASTPSTSVLASGADQMPDFLQGQSCILDLGPDKMH